MKQLARRLRIRNSPIIIGSLILALASAGASAANLEVEFDASNFTPGADIDNDYWPLLANASFVYYAEGVDGCEVNQMTVAGAPLAAGFFNAPYNTIRAWPVVDKAWVSEECDGVYALVEDTIDWFAQDMDGNVWYFGEDTTAFDHDDACPSTAGAWKAGSDIADVGSNAEPGIVMLAIPEVGLTYPQEYYEDEAEDMAKILQLDDLVSIEFGEFAGCLKTKEWSPLERGAVEHKFYCKMSEGGVGLTLINELQGKTLRVEYVGTSLDDVPSPEGGGNNTFATEGVCPD